MRRHLSLLTSVIKDFPEEISQQDQIKAAKGFNQSAPITDLLILNRISSITAENLKRIENKKDLEAVQADAWGDLTQFKATIKLLTNSPESLYTMSTGKSNRQTTIERCGCSSASNHKPFSATCQLHADLNLKLRCLTQHLRPASQVTATDYKATRSMLSLSLRVDNHRTAQLQAQTPLLKQQIELAIQDWKKLFLKQWSRSSQ